MYMIFFSTIVHIFEKIFFPLVAHAAYDLQLPSFANASDPASLVNAIYQYALGIAGTLAVVMIVYGGVKYVVTGGNGAAQKDAMDIIKSAVWGIVLLGGAFLILNTVNPTLTILKNPGLTPVTIVAPPTTSGGPASGPYDPVVDPASTKNSDTHIAQLAQQYLQIKSGDGLSKSSTCTDGSDPYSIMTDVSQGHYPYVCSPGCSKQISNGCSAGANNNVTLSTNLLDKFITAEQARKTGGVPNYTVSSLTGGPHHNGSAHYTGNAADIVPTGGLTDWSKVFDYFQKIGASPYYEFDSTTLCNGWCFTQDWNIGQHILDSTSSNRHLHVQF